MRYLLLIVLLLIPFPAVALTGPAVRFDFSQGQPDIAANETSACNSQTTVRYDFSAGQPAQAFDATATCTAAAGGGSNAARVLIQGGQINIGGGTMLIQ